MYAFSCTGVFPRHGFSRTIRGSIPWGSFRLFGQGKMLEMAFLRIPFLVSKTTDLLQDGKMMTGGIYRVSFLFRVEGLIAMDRLF